MIKLRNSLIFPAFFSVALVLSGCAAQKHAVRYTPAVPNGGKMATRYVPVPMPGQLKPLASTKASKVIKGVEAIQNANQKATKQPKSDRYIDAIMTYDYMPGALYQIYSAPLKVTDIQFGPAEKIISVAAGDTLRWEVSKTYSGGESGRVEHLVIKPVEENLSNSLLITTNRRAYHLELHSTPATYMAFVKWNYSEGGEDFVEKFSSDADADNSGSDGKIFSNPADLDFAYEIKIIKGNKPDWYPASVFSDGSKTYIQLPDNMQEAPALFVGEGKDVVEVVNYRVKGNYYVIDSVVQQAQLRSSRPSPTIIQISKKS